MIFYRIVMLEKLYKKNRKIYYLVNRWKIIYVASIDDSMILVKRNKDKKNHY